MEQSKINIKKHVIGFKELKAAYVKELHESGKSPALQRRYLKEWEAGFKAAHESMPDWFEGMPSFLPPEYRIHPIMGHQVRSRHRYIPDTESQENRLAAKKHTGFKQPKLKPYEADPSYRDPKEPEHGKEDLHGVKQYPVRLESDDTYVDPSFIGVKSDRLRRSAEILEFKIGYDHKSNTHVLYSPLKYSERWDRQSQVLWLRSIGMSPKRISIRLKIKIDTVKNWLRVFKDQPMVACTQYDWAIRQVEGRAELSTRFSSLEAKPRAMEAI